MIRFTLPIIIAFASVLSAFAQKTLLTDQGVTISAQLIKTTTGKKHDTWQVTVSTQTTAENLYFTALKTNNPLSDLSLNRYAAINIANGAGLFAPKVKYLTGAKAHLITTGSSLIYLIPPTATETFNVDVESGSTPELHASLLVAPKTQTQVSFLKATDQELFAGATPDRLMFIYLRPLDSLLIRRDRMLSWQSADKKKSAAEFVNGNFLIVQNGQEGTTTDHLSVSGWQGQAFSVRITGSQFETSSNGLFTDSYRSNVLLVKDADGADVLVKIEPIAKNVLAFDARVLPAALPSSPNGEYALRVTGGALALVHLASPSRTVWTSVDFGNESGLTVVADKDYIIVRITAMVDQKGTGDENAKFLTVTDDGHLLFFRSDGYAVWTSASMMKQH